MTREDKQLLLKDLGARLLDGVKVLDLITDTVKDVIGLDITSNYITVKSGELSHTVFFDDVKPYLRPMSSMTEEERKEYGLILCDELSINQFDWLNANHFDYHGLIEKGLALEVTEENNPYKA